MIREDVDAVLSDLLVDVIPLPAERVRAGSGVGRVLSSDVLAPGDLPPHDLSAMDGFAVCAADVASSTEPTVRLRLVGASMAGGETPTPHHPGTACQIATGAVVPPGFDTVVRVERASLEDESVWVPSHTASGSDVRRQGEDARAGSVIATAGTRLGPLMLAGLAGSGVEHVEVHGAPSVALVPTGDELVAGHIPDALTPGLSALVERWGGRVTTREPVRDDLAALTDAVREAARDADLVITTGGASVGPRDHAGALAVAHGGRQRQLRLRPGRPFAHAMLGGALIMCLPGSPTAALAVATVLVRPVLARLAGLPAPAHVDAPLSRGSVVRRADVRQLLPARLGEVAELIPGNGAGDLARLARSNAFVDIPGGDEPKPGDSVAVHPL